MARQPRIERTDAREESGRRTRVPLGVARSKLSFKKREGYVRRVVNDDEGRLQLALDGDYTFVLNEQNSHLGSEDIDNVNRDLGSRVSRVVNKSTGQKGYLMEIKEEYYKEDQAEKAATVAEKDNLIKNGKLDDGEGRYIPDKGKGISIETR